MRFLLGVAGGAFGATLLLLISFARYGVPMPRRFATEPPFEIPFDPNTMSGWEFSGLSTTVDATGQLVN